MYSNDEEDTTEEKSGESKEVEAKNKGRHKAKGKEEDQGIEGACTTLCLALGGWALSMPEF